MVFVPLTVYKLVYATASKIYVVHFHEIYVRFLPIHQNYITMCSVKRFFHMSAFWPFKPFKVIQDIDFGSDRNRVCDFLLVCHSNLSCTVSNILQVFELMTTLLFHPNSDGVPVGPDRRCWGQYEHLP